MNRTLRSSLLPASRRRGGGFDNSMVRAMFYNSNLKLWLRPNLPGSGASWTDAATGLNTGTLVNTPTWGDRGLTLNGISQYSNNGTNSSLKITTAQSGACWFRPNSLTMGDLPALFMVAGYNTGPTISGAWMGWNQEATGNDFLYAVCANSTGGGVKGAKSWGSGDLGLWWHAAYTWTGTNWHLYINGVLDATDGYGSGSVGPGNDNTYPAMVGCINVNGGPMRYFDGIIGSVQVRNTPLTEGQTMALYKYERDQFGFY